MCLEKCVDLKSVQAKVLKCVTKIKSGDCIELTRFRGYVKTLKISDLTAVNG